MQSVAEKVVVLDVRDELRQGGEPFERIMAAAKQLEPGQELELWATFEPRPLFGVMDGLGFGNEPERQPDGDWRVRFYRKGAPRPAGEPMRRLQLDELAQFRAEGPAPVALDRRPEAKRMLIGLRAGQVLPKHSQPCPVSIHFLSGKATFTTSEQSVDVRPSSLMLLAAGVTHAIEAIEDTVVLVTMTPDPSAS